MILNLARHESTEGVTFNVVRPSAIMINRNREVLSDPAYERAVTWRIPLGWIGKPSDCVPREYQRGGKAERPFPEINPGKLLIVEDTDDKILGVSMGEQVEKNLV